MACHGCARTIHSTPPRSSYPEPVKKTPVKDPPTSRPYSIAGKRYTPLKSAKGFSQKGIASWYGKKFHGRKTANGEIYNMYAMTAAHKTLPMGTWVRVFNLENNRRIDIRINDRGPFVSGRIIDLSYTGAKKLGMANQGTAKVKLVALGRATAYSLKTSKPVKYEAVDYWKGNFTVQVGAFQVKSNAVNFKKKLSRRFKNAHIMVHRDWRGTFYRVRIMKYSNLKHAMDFAEKYKNSGLGNAFVVAE
ncbi:MAG: septal ring lytic transglycosylase RlpA family protein [Desulfobacteraceae bacterium]|nr:MAG: septal ring lytic transglycosylase RlpA family protein [Desulfobacteraceae bacterium]